MAELGANTGLAVVVPTVPSPAFYFRRHDGAAQYSCKCKFDIGTVHAA